MTYSGVTIPAGQMVMYSLAAANRDPRWVEDPGTFDITRSTSGAIYFAHGNHHCIGAHLARIEGRVAIGDADRGPPGAGARRRTRPSSDTGTAA